MFIVLTDLHAFYVYACTAADGCIGAMWLDMLLSSSAR